MNISIPFPPMSFFSKFSTFNFFNPMIAGIIYRNWLSLIEFIFRSRCSILPKHWIISESFLASKSWLAAAPEHNLLLPSFSNFRFLKFANSCLTSYSPSTPNQLDEILSSLNVSKLIICLKQVVNYSFTMPFSSRLRLYICGFFRH